MLLNLVLIVLNLITSFFVIRLSRLLCRHKTSAEIKTEHQGKNGDIEYRVRTIDAISKVLTSRIEALDDDLSACKTKIVLLERTLETIGRKKREKKC